jgi:hypothetical protein
MPSLSLGRMIARECFFFCKISIMVRGQATRNADYIHPNQRFRCPDSVPVSPVLTQPRGGMLRDPSTGPPPSFICRPFPRRKLENLRELPGARVSSEASDNDSDRDEIMRDDDAAPLVPPMPPSPPPPPFLIQGTFLGTSAKNCGVL